MTDPIPAALSSLTEAPQLDLEPIKNLRRRSGTIYGDVADDLIAEIERLRAKPSSSLTDALRAQIEKLRAKALAPREEAGRIRRTIIQPTDAEERCNVRAEVWEREADELTALLARDVTPETTPEECSCAVPYYAQVCTLCGKVRCAKNWTGSPHAHTSSRALTPGEGSPPKIGESMGLSENLIIVPKRYTAENAAWIDSHNQIAGEKAATPASADAPLNGVDGYHIPKMSGPLDAASSPLPVPQREAEGAKNYNTRETMLHRRAQIAESDAARVTKRYQELLEAFDGLAGRFCRAISERERLRAALSASPPTATRERGAESGERQTPNGDTYGLTE